MTERRKIWHVSNDVYVDAVPGSDYDALAVKFAKAAVRISKLESMIRSMTVEPVRDRYGSDELYQQALREWYGVTV